MIRQAEPKDMESVVAIYNQAIAATFQTAYTEQIGSADGEAWFRQYLDEAYPLFVYVKDEMVVGWLSISPYRSGREALRYTVEISYFIHFGYQGKGIGQKLVAHGLNACRQLNYKTVLAIILDKNLASIRLMEKCGFQKWAYLPGVADFGGIECGHVYYGLRLA